MADLKLKIDLDPVTGQLRSILDPQSGIAPVQFAAGHELELNSQPLTTTLVKCNESNGDHVTQLDAPVMLTYGAGYRLEICRFITAGGVGLHTGAPDSVHIRYFVRRVPWGNYQNDLDMIWGAPLESPLRIDTLTALTAPTPWFGPSTRMRAIAIGGSGPREHVSYEDGPVSEVVPWLQTGFRSTFPGQMTVPGALYYHPDDERFVWIITRRPHVGGRIRFSTERQAFEFAYFKNMPVHSELTTPEINIFWGQGLKQAERVLAQQFDRYEEPPQWWDKTSWFWLHPMWQRGASFRHCEEAVRILAGECGVTGFGLGSHDIPWSGRDIDIASLMPGPSLGGDEGMKKLTDVIRSVGGHSYVWSTRTGLHPVRDRREKWRVRGEDGRALSARPPGCVVQVDMLNNDDADYRKYLLATVEHYVRHLGIDGMFWDSGTQPMPPDFTPRPDSDCPGESMTALLRFYEDVYRMGKSLSKDFFMWFEGISTDIRTNAFAVDNRKHGPRSAHPLLHRIANLGPRRLVWRSAWPHDIASGFPFISPTNDIKMDPGAATYHKIAADPVNRWVCRIVRERGCKNALGLGDGVSLLDEFVVTCPGITGPVSIPANLLRGSRLRHAIDGVAVTGQSQNDGTTTFDLPKSGPWVMESPAGVTNGSQLVQSAP